MNTHLAHLRMVLSIALVLFSPGARATDISRPITNELHGKHFVSYHATNDALEETWSPSVTHPKKHHHIVRRRVSSQSFFKSAAFFPCEDNTATSDILTGPAHYYYTSFLRPSYYVFLFRCALF